MTFDARPERTSHRPGDDVVLLLDSLVAQRVSVVATHLGDEVRRSDDEVAVGRTRGVARDAGRGLVCGPRHRCGRIDGHERSRRHG